MPLTSFHPVTTRWFAEVLGEPTAAQRRGWASIRDGRHTLIAAPTGSGKTLAAFLSALDDLLQEGIRAPLPDEVRVVYVSPLKALSADIHKNLSEPRTGIHRLATEMGFAAPRITAAVRTGDTTQGERAAMLRTPPHVLVTTPESLYLLLTAERSREMLRTARTVIVDEIHAVIGGRRGAHLALSLERLQHVAERPLVRIGLSATQKPIEEVGRFLVGVKGACAIVDEGHRREMDVDVEIPRSPLEAVMSHEVWEEYYDRLAQLIAAHRTTLVFVNTRRMAERLARHLSERVGENAVAAHHGSLSKEKRLDSEVRLKAGELKALVATASLELGIDIGHVDLACQIGSPHRIATFIQRVGRSGHTVSGVPKGRLFPMSRDDLVECLALLRSYRLGDLDRVVSHDAPLDVLTQQVVAETSCCEYSEDELFDLVRTAWPFRDLVRRDFDAVVAMAAEGFATRRGRRGALIHRDEVHAHLRGRRGTRLLAITSGGAIPETADYRVLLDPDDTFIGTLNEDFAIESMAGDVFQLGNTSWRILQVGPGTVRVADAKGAPPNIPFWLGEAPARSDELSKAVSDLRADVDGLLFPDRADPIRLTPDATDTGVVRLKPDTTDTRVVWLKPDTTDMTVRLKPDTTEATTDIDPGVASGFSRIEDESPVVPSVSESAVVSGFSRTVDGPGVASGFSRIEDESPVVPSVSESAVVSGFSRTVDGPGVASGFSRIEDESPVVPSVSESAVVSGFSRTVDDPGVASDFSRTVTWLAREAGVSLSAAEQAVAYLAEGRRALGVMPTQDTLVLERFFDESGGMQLVLHAPFGSRINKAWGLALRKRFCRQFNFELQAAATEDALLLSLGPQHSFPLADVFRYLHPATARDVLVQAFLDAPVFQTRWRWNTTISLAVPRNRAGKKVAPQLQRMLADDLMAATFPEAAACLENIPGDRQIPDHPLVNQTVRDCLDEAMDFQGLTAVLGQIHAGALRLVSCDTPQPSPLSHEIVNARPYAFLDDAPLEERRTQAVYARRATDPSSADGVGRLDVAAIERVRGEARPDPRDAEELHDALLSAGVLTSNQLAVPASSSGHLPNAADDVAPVFAEWFARLVEARRAVAVVAPCVAWVAAERLPELWAIHPHATVHGHAVPPASRTQRTWTREDAIIEMLRSQLTIVGPTTARALARVIGIDETESTAALVALESDGSVLRGSFTGTSADIEWCDRRLLARIHRYTLARLRAEIEPVSPSVFTRFLFVWQHVHQSNRLTGIDGLRTILASLDGFEVAASAWERAVLPARLDGYEPSLLDTLCLAGETGWARFSAPVPAAPAGRLIGATPIALFVREHADAWLASQTADTTADVVKPDQALGAMALAVFDTMQRRGASFVRELAVACAADETTIGVAVGELAAAGLAASDGFAGLRSMLTASGERQVLGTSRGSAVGRWSLLRRDGAAISQEAAVEIQARSLLARYGVVFRRLLTREPNAAPWRDVSRLYRRLEARGEIRGGRFVAGMSGEQFALPEAVERLREVRRSPHDGRLMVISAADPLNLTGIVTAGDRVRAVATNRVVYRDGVPIAALEGDYMRPLVESTAQIGGDVASALTGRLIPGVVSGYVGRAG